MKVLAPIPIGPPPLNDPDSASPLTSRSPKRDTGIRERGTGACTLQNAQVLKPAQLAVLQDRNCVYFTQNYMRYPLNVGTLYKCGNMLTAQSVFPGLCYRFQRSRLTFRGDICKKVTPADLGIEGRACTYEDLQWWRERAYRNQKPTPSAALRKSDIQSPEKRPSIKASIGKQTGTVGSLAVLGAIGLILLYQLRPTYGYSSS